MRRGILAVALLNRVNPTGVPQPRGSLGQGAVLAPAISRLSRATIGSLSNAEHQNVKIGKAGRNRHKGKRPQTRGVAMNPVDHPHGGGEAHHTPGGHPVTPWGKPTLGYRTRKKGKQSDRYIVRGRRRGKKKR